MANVIIGGTASGATALPAAVSIDGANDLLAVYTASATATQAISRNTLLGVSGQPADISSVQTLTNKVLANSNTITVKDAASLTLQNAADTTKQARFSLASITTGNTRTFTLPDTSDTILTLAATQTLTNKTLTSPTINGGTLDNATVTVDTVSGHAVSNTGTIYGISVTTGTIAAAALASGSVTYTKVGTDSSFAWSTWSASPQGFSGSPTTNYARYIQLGKTVFVVIDFTGTSNATSCSFTLPVAPKNTFQMPVSIEDNTAYPTGFGLIKVAAASTTANVYKDGSSAAFTNSGTKALTGAYLVYEVA